MEIKKRVLKWLFSKRTWIKNIKYTAKNKKINPFIQYGKYKNLTPIQV